MICALTEIISYHDVLHVVINK